MAFTATGFGTALALSNEKISGSVINRTKKRFTII